MFSSVLLTLLSLQSTLAAVISPILVLESSGNGIIYVPGVPITSVPGSVPITTVPGPASRSSSVPIISISRMEISSGGTPSELSIPSIAGISATASGDWPASITYVAETGSSTVVGVAFVTTVNGTSKITTTKPQQSLIPATGSGYNLVAITEGSVTTTLTLNDLPSATLPSEPTGLQVVTQSGLPVTYSPITLSGYNNTEPVEISTSFVETINGQTTTQGGWWLIGSGGRIYPPRGRPWKTGSGVGCLAGPLFCRTSCVDIGLFEICNPDGGGSGGGGDGEETGPPGFPGGSSDGGGEPGDNPPPYEQPSPDEEPEQMTEFDASKTIEDKTTSTTRPGSISASTSASFSASNFVSTSASLSAAQYFVVATPGADVAAINAFLGQIAPKSDGSYAPFFATNTVDGGFWTASLSPQAAILASSRSDLSIIETYTNSLVNYPSWTTSLFSDTGTVDLETLYGSTLSPIETAAAKNRRKVPDGGSSSNSGLSFHSEARDRNAEVEFKNHSGGTEPIRVLKRDPGIRTVRQTLSGKDLAVISWAPGVPSVANVDFIFSERKGENTWVYVLDSGVNAQHREFRTNWPGTYGRFNIDPEVLRDPTYEWPVSGFLFPGSESHGTCMASKVCGAKTGVAKQATVISVIYTHTVESFLACLNLVLTNVRVRQGKGQALAGRTVLSISLGIPPDEVSRNDSRYMQALLQSIMNLGVICVCAAGNYADTLGFPRTIHPAVLATTAFPLIPVGAVDITGEVAYFSQEGMIYAVGVDSPCASIDDNLLTADADGSSGATAMFAGLIALTMSEPGNVYGFGNDVTRYQQLVKNYYTVGYNSRRANVHPPGSYYRPGSYAPVVWNGLDGSRSNVCPLDWNPLGFFKKRDATDPATSSDICAGYTPHSVIIYSRAEESCLDSLSICAFDFFLYSVSDPSGVPSNICNGDGFIGSVLETGPSNSIAFTLPTTTDDSGNENLSFVYGWTSDDDSGWVTGGSLTAPIACVAEPTSDSSLTQTCTLEETDSKRKRAVGPIGQPAVHPVNYVYKAFARCVWVSD